MMAESVWPGGEGTQVGEGLQQVWTMEWAKKGEVVAAVGAWLSNFQGPILATGFGFCTGIQNQLAVLTGLALVKLKEKWG